MGERFATMLAGGHPNSLGRTEEVVALVLAEETRFAELFDSYGSDDEVVRLRVSSAIKRVAKARPELVMGIMDRLFDEIGMLDQASAQWTLAQIFDLLTARMNSDQRVRAKALMQRNLAEHDDWIVLNMTMATLTTWATQDAKLARWLAPHLQQLTKDKRKSVAGRAKKMLAKLGAA